MTGSDKTTIFLFLGYTGILWSIITQCSTEVYNSTSSQNNFMLLAVIYCNQGEQATSA
jgi:hypothetical protein